MGHLGFGNQLVQVMCVTAEKRWLYSRVRCYKCWEVGKGLERQSLRFCTGVTVIPLHWIYEGERKTVFLSTELNVYKSVLLQRAAPVVRFVCCNVSSSSCVDVKSYCGSVRRDSWVAVLITAGLTARQSANASSARSWEHQSGDAGLVGVVLPCSTGGQWKGDRKSLGALSFFCLSKTVGS